MAPSSLPWKTAAKQWRRERDEALALTFTWRPVVRAAVAKCRIAWDECKRLRGELEAAHAVIAAWRPVLAAAVVLRNSGDWPPMRSHVASLETAVDALTPAARKAVHNA